MGIDGNHLKIRIAVVGVLATVGAASMSRLPQLLPAEQAIPWYQSPFFLSGMALVVIALLILIVPPRFWRHLGQSVWGFPGWIRETYLWKRYGPIYSFGKPKISSHMSEDGRTVYYEAQVSLYLKNRDNNPLKVILSSMKIRLEQEGGHSNLFVDLIVPSGSLLQDALLQSQEQKCYDVILSESILNNPALILVDTHKPYRWRIGGLSVHLVGIEWQELSKKGEKDA